MHHARTKLFLSFTALALLNHTAQAAGFQLYELGTPVIGTAAVGQAAIASDASTSYFNPAGMAQLKQSQFMLGSQMIVPKSHVNLGSGTTILGDNGGNAGALTPGLDFYYAYSYSPQLKFGVSFTSPYGGNLNYNDGWAGRYLVQDMLFYTLNLNPSVAYQVNSYIAFGAGVAIEYANLSQTVALPLEPSVDGQASIKADNIAPGFNAGVLLTPTPKTKLGIAYRSRILHNLNGNTTFYRISDKPATSTKMTMPQNVIISLVQGVTDRFNLLGELGWSNWGAMQSTVVNIASYSTTTNLDWHDTYRAGVGGQYKVTQALLMQAGVSYDSSPTNASHRTPDLPIDRQVRAALGLIYDFIPAVELGLSYEYINFGSAPITNPSSLGVLQGSYSQNYANVVQVSLNVSC